VLTRIEIDGFKNLVDFSVEFGPFTCLAGPNGVGKSNLFDAIKFLSLLSDHTLMEAALLVRGNVETSDIRDLFTSGSAGIRPAWPVFRPTRHEPSVGTADGNISFRIAAEMIVEPNVLDDVGRRAEATSTFLRYEIEIGYEEPGQRGTLGRLVLLSEKLDHIKEGEAATKLRFPHSANSFRKVAVTNKRRSHVGFISVDVASDGQTEIVVHQDGGSRGPGQVAVAASAPRTILGTSNTSATPTILAARREMQKWRFIALEPSAMRRPDRPETDAHVTTSGGHLPATIFRLANASSKSGGDADSVCASIAARLSQLVPVADLRVDVDEVRQLLTIQVLEQTGVRLPAASLSDGTLRFLALGVLLEDPESSGLICIEEPENGIHPAKLPEMVRLLRDLAVDPSEAPGPDNPFRQVIVATHSPAFVQLQERDDLLFAMDARVRGVDGGAVRTLRCRALNDTWRSREEEPGVGLGTILAYLSSPPGAQLELPQAGS
jgi:predicted ATPase